LWRHSTITSAKTEDRRWIRPRGQIAEKRARMRQKRSEDAEEQDACDSPQVDGWLKNRIKRLSTVSAYFQDLSC